MFDKLLGSISRVVPRRIAEVGWLLDTDSASLIWEAPRLFSRKLPAPKTAKSVQVCPAAVEFDARHFVIASPIDINLRFRFDDKGQPALINVDGAQSSIRSKHLNAMVSLINRAEWRHPDRPILQIITPYVFLSDDQVYINQLPPYLDYVNPPWPGVLISGRFPIDVWPRTLMWAFEWHDIGKDLVISRGDPWFYARFETDDPTQRVRLVEAELTPDVREYMKSISGVTNYVNRTFSLFDRARERRPKTLLVKRQR